MIRNRDIIVVGLQPWDIKIGSNCKNMALEMSRNNRVLYVNRALDRISVLRSAKDEKVQTRRNSLRGETNDITPVNNTLWTLDPRTILESINWIPFDGLFNRCNYINNKRLAKEINQAVKRLEFKNILLFIDNDFFRALYLPELLEDVHQTIYYIRDKLTSQPYFKKHGTRLEPELMKKATMVAANSAYLAQYAQLYNESAFDIGQGCDFDWLKNPLSGIPRELQSLQRPVIGYVGALLAARLDISMLEGIATQMPEWSIVLVGPEDDAFRKSRLHQLPNVFFTGNRLVEQLPAYINSFDVCINPQVVNEMTIGNYPRKIDEYLALGKPVVATDTVAMQMFAPYVYLCRNQDEYISKIVEALQEDPESSLREKRIRFALSHTWENCVAEMGKHLDQVVSRNYQNALV
ncbi:Glycosyl transferases group 1 [Chitinophaga sp. CF118]|uniref:glycosyltransferase n=1 Tax=Chitinophaga sp. CF118 TaxID=1884367 RepID=UPI0008F2DB92|nr:glycosyltransferase [Chitinophaga sp. CF118]SFE92879.1 Glycosyl transferases group 1 [Chitinophaga sp. CF118]